MSVHLATLVIAGYVFPVPTCGFLVLVGHTMITISIPIEGLYSVIFSNLYLLVRVLFLELLCGGFQLLAYFY